MSEDLDISTMTLGDVIASLEALNPDLPMRTPLGFGSWRGSYAELTLHADFTPRDVERQAVGDLLALARKADGSEFTGYKGGKYRMDRRTQVWGDGWGDCNYWRPVGFVVRDGTVVVQRINVGSSW